MFPIIVSILLGQIIKKGKLQYMKDLIKPLVMIVGEQNSQMRIQQTYLSFFSNHNPIILNPFPKNPTKKKTYELEAWCLSFPGIKEKIKDVWSLHSQGSSAFKLQRKLQDFLSYARVWCFDFKIKKAID